MKKKTFEEQFPSLKGKLMVSYEHDNVMSFQRYLDCYVYFKEDIEEFCLDKQKVRDTILKFWSQELNTWIGSGEEIIKELGL